MIPANVISLREVLREQYPEAHAHALSSGGEMGAIQTGWACLDGMRLMQGTVAEIVDERGSAGAGLLLLALMEAERESLRPRVALVDGADAFDPASASMETLNRLLWVRCRDANRAIRAADLLLRDGNITRVLLDLQFCPAQALRQIPAPAWHRLRMLAEKAGTLLCAFTSFQMVPCARARLFLEETHAVEALDGSREGLLSELRGRVQQRGGRKGLERRLNSMAEAG
ncbi:hypothetical protein FEM03_17420 [Phragmitibacter flavus]|uniref:DNA recombination and repair protein Rad51-like C-terminal domain-containing protein n=1 Tax=Phragmitibacter flavus TaxID=2576071 RepID=A0A5R8KAT2_9BACT|nr:hypothetical protein [Phragmitibacter flavus]TLD69424.1 hypothetical protein FEM03_17420 [Phragmitibacter flavus]